MRPHHSKPLPEQIASAIFYKPAKVKKYKRFQQTTSTSTEDTEAVPTSPPVSEALAENGLTVMQKLLDEAGLLRGNENLLSLLGVKTGSCIKPHQHLYRPNLYARFKKALNTI